MQASTSWGWPKFIELDKLTQPEQGFLVDDTVFVRVDVTVKVGRGVPACLGRCILP
jgi:hypothetical protein